MKSLFIMIATVSFDDNFFDSMPSFSFNEPGSTSPVVYSETHSTARTLASSSTEIVWEGTIAGNSHVGFATLASMADGHVSGNFNTETATCSLVQLPNGKSLC